METPVCFSSQTVQWHVSRARQVAVGASKGKLEVARLLSFVRSLEQLEIYCRLPKRQLIVFAVDHAKHHKVSILQHCSLERPFDLAIYSDHRQPRGSVLTGLENCTCVPKPCTVINTFTGD